MRKILKLLVIVCLTVSCGNLYQDGEAACLGVDQPKDKKADLPLPILVGSETYFPALEIAVHRWNLATGCLVFEMTDQGDQDILVEEVDNNYFDNEETIARERDGKIQFREYFDKEVGVYTHELGHSLGFGHADCEDSVMYKRLKENQVITPQMIEMVLERCEE